MLRMRTGGVFLSPVGGHWRDLLDWRARVPELGFTLDTSHAALFRSFAAAYPCSFGLASDEGLELERYVEELGPAAEVAHVSDAAGLLGEGLEYGSGELDLDPIVRRLGELVPYIVAEINEPDHSRSPGMKAGYRAIEARLGGGRRAAAAPAAAARPGRRLRLAAGRRTARPGPLGARARGALSPGAARADHRRRAARSAARSPRCCSASARERITVIDAHEASLAADRRARDAASLAHLEYVLCDVRDRERVERRAPPRRPDVVFHLAAYKHVDLAERFPRGVRRHEPRRLLERAARRRARPAPSAVVVASTDKAALAASLYGRTKRFMEQLAARLRRARRRARSRCAWSTCSAARAAPRSSSCARRAPGAADRHRPGDGPLLDHAGHATTLLAHARADGR